MSSVLKMPTQIVLTGTTGLTPPFSGVACDYYGNNCSYVGSGTTTPITFVLPSQFDTAPSINLTITDLSGCTLTQIIYCSIIT